MSIHYNNEQRSIPHAMDFKETNEIMFSPVRKEFEDFDKKRFYIKSNIACDPSTLSEILRKNLNELFNKIIGIQIKLKSILILCDAII